MINQAKREQIKRLIGLSDADLDELERANQQTADLEKQFRREFKGKGTNQGNKQLTPLELIQARTKTKAKSANRIKEILGL